MPIHPVPYQATLWALFALLTLLLVQMLVAATSKARLPGAVPGKLDPQLNHADFAFRAQRTFINSLENLPLWLGTLMLAWQSQASPTWTAIFSGIFVFARLIHMGLYYIIATERNPSPRSGFYLLGLLANMALLGMVGLHLINLN